MLISHLDLAFMDGATASVADGLKSLLYRCEFGRVVERVDALRLAGVTAIEFAGALVLAANAHFERHEAAAARACLDEANGLLGSEDHDGEALYYRARVQYMAGKHAEAADLFRLVATDGPTIHTRINGVLGLANVLYSQEDYAGATRQLTVLHGNAARFDSHQAISVQHLAVNLAVARSQTTEATVESALAAVARAQREGFLYWIIKGHYILAKTMAARGQERELRLVLIMLKHLLTGSECHHLIHLVNTCFVDMEEAILQTVELDEARMSVTVGTHTATLRAQPLLFAFVAALHRRPGFVDKEALVQAVWPDERYNPRIHDGRIHNLANRARAILERHPDQPSILVAGRLGYRLIRDSASCRGGQGALAPSRDLKSTKSLDRDRQL